MGRHCNIDVLVGFIRGKQLSTGSDRSRVFCQTIIKVCKGVCINKIGSHLFYGIVISGGFDFLNFEVLTIANIMYCYDRV